MELKNKKDDFLVSMLLGTPSASLLRNILAGKGFMTAEYGSKDKQINTAGYGSKKSLIENF